MRLLFVLAALVCLAGCKDQSGPTHPAEKGSKQSGPPRGRDGIDVRIDANLYPHVRAELQQALDKGVAFQRVELLEAIKKGLIVAKARGGGLQSAGISMELKSNLVLAVDITSATFLGATNTSVQNMVVLASSTAWLSPGQPEQEISVAVACANMPLDAPIGQNELVIQPLPTRGTIKWADLRKLITSPGFVDADRMDRQFAVWTITDNPAGHEYKRLQVSSRNGLPPAQYGPNLDAIRALFEKAGINPAGYAAFRQASETPQQRTEEMLLLRLRQVHESRAETEKAIYERASAMKLSQAETRAKIDAAEGVKRLKELAVAIERALKATGERLSISQKTYEAAKAKGVWEDTALQAGEEAAREAAKAETSAHAEADTLYKRSSDILIVPLRK